MGLIKKAEEALSGKDSSQSANNGPHDSSLLNKLDPRVDSDRGTCLTREPGTVPKTNKPLS